MNRTILKKELAKKLYPHSISEKSALELMRREIIHSSKLKQQLVDMGPVNRHYFNHQQLQIILKHFGVSKEEFESLSNARNL